MEVSAVARDRLLRAAASRALAASGLDPVVAAEAARALMPAGRVRESAAWWWALSCRRVRLVGCGGGDRLARAAVAAVPVVDDALFARLGGE